MIENLPDLMAATPEETARAAGLRYATDSRPGIRRKRSGRGFYYVKADGQRVTDRRMLDRIKSLKIPPAWNDVWISPLATSHLQATGLDSRRRKQYIYHPMWRQVRDENKFYRMLAFGRILPEIRQRVEDDLRRPGLTREKALATIVRLLEKTLIRVGNEEYAKANDSYGLTTLRDDHVSIKGETINFRFRGKKGKDYDIGIRDRRLAKLVRKFQDLPGQELFEYLDDNGRPHAIESGDVNDYIREISGSEFTAKDFRTWAGTVLAAIALCRMEVAESKHRTKLNISQAIKQTAEHLGNTPAICRKAYVHPEILAAYADGALRDAWLQNSLEEIAGDEEEIRAAEKWVLSLLEKRLESQQEDLQKKAA